MGTATAMKWNILATRGRRTSGRVDACAGRVLRRLAIDVTTRKMPAVPGPRSRLGRMARMGLAAGELAAGAAAEGLRRIVRGQAPDFRGALLSTSNAEKLVARLARLRGAAMKLGQLVSLQGEDVLPPEFAQALAVLRSQAAPMPPQQLRRVLTAVKTIALEE